MELRFKPHPRARAEGRDLTMTLPGAPWEAALGASVNAPTPGGTVEVTIPPGSGNGRKLRLRGRGIPGDPPGDLYLVLELVLPPARMPMRSRSRRSAVSTEEHTSELQHLTRNSSAAFCL